MVLSLTGGASGQGCLAPVWEAVEGAGRASGTGDSPRGSDAGSVSGEDARPNEKEEPAKPGARFLHSFAYDSARGEAVVFGGQGLSGRLGDTWVWNGERWMLASTGGPSARAGQNMAFDSARGRVVLFGGALANNSMLAETWEWDGATWARNGATGPAARIAHAMSFDEARGRIVLFGGYAGGRLASDTWTFDGAKWVLMPAGGPGPRSYPAAAYDSARQRVVLFGGGTGGKPVGDTWEWDGSAWSQRAVTGPGARSYASMAFDPNRGRVVLFGGLAGDGVRFNDTWEFDGAAWILRPDPAAGKRVPVGREGPAMCFDAARAEMLVFGGRVARGASKEVMVVDELWRQPGGGPRISRSPTSRSRPVGSSISFGIAAAASTGTIGYQWRRNGENLAPGERFGGVYTSVLTITSLAEADAGEYDCVANNACGVARSASARLVIGCAADFDDGSGSGTPDGGVSVEDLMYFIQIWRAGSVAADLDDGTGSGTPDGGVGIEDYLYYLDRFEQGC